MLELLKIWLPIDASAHGAELDSMTAIIHWMMAILFVGWAIYFIVVLIRFRAGKNPTANYDGVKSHFSTYVEGGVVVAEIILLAAFGIPVWAQWVTPPPPEANALRVRVIGEQFAWNVHYPGPDGFFGRTLIELIDTTNAVGLDRSDPLAKDDVVKINQLHLPVNRPITVLLGSKDVIHSFNLPYMRVKQDAIPGMEIPVHFTAVMETPEEARLPGCAPTVSCWEIGCAQLCGLGHYRMRGFLEIHSQEGFEEWMSKQLARLQPAEPEPAEESTDTES